MILRLLSFFVFVSLVTSSAASQEWAISHVTIVDVEAGRLIPSQTVIIQGERISRIRDTTPGDTGQCRDASGLYMIPSLFDCHVHWNQPVRDGLLFASHGVGFVRDMGGTNRERLSLRERSAKGELSGVRCLVTGAILDGADPYHPAISFVCDTPEQGREAVKKQKLAGVDFIKAYSKLKPDVFFAICDEAKSLGIPVVGHVPDSVTVFDATNAGMQTNEHLSRIESVLEAAVPTSKRPKSDLEFSFSSLWWRLYPTIDPQALNDRIAETKEMIQCPTLILVAGYGRIPPSEETLNAWKRFASDDELKSWTTKPDQWAKFADDTASSWPRILDLVGKLDKQGVKLVTGTDLGNPYAIAGYSLHDEMSYLALAGLTPRSILAAATINSAKLLKVDRDYGSIAPGKSASFVLLRKNPLEDVRNTLSIDSVTLRGQRMDRVKLDEMQSDAELFRDYMTPGNVEAAKEQPPGEQLSRDRYVHLFQAWEVGEEVRALYSSPGGTTARTLNLQSSWGKVPVDLIQVFDVDGQLISARWKVFAKRPYAGKIQRTGPNQIEYRVTKGNMEIERTIEFPKGCLVDFPVGSSLDPRRWLGILDKGKLPVMSLTWDGEPETLEFVQVGAGQATGDDSRELVITNSQSADVIKTLRLDANGKLIQETSGQRSFKLK